MFGFDFPARSAGGRRRVCGLIAEDVQCKYVADSFPDALRRCPHAEFLHVDTAEMFGGDLDDDADVAIADHSLTIC